MTPSFTSTTTVNVSSSHLNYPPHHPHSKILTPPPSHTTSAEISALHSVQTPTTFASPSTDEPPGDPHTAGIKPGKETTIEIIKEKMGLGLSIVGGSDTLLGAIIIHEVYPDGAAAKDGRLKPGDQILEVNNENFRVITHQKALNVLRQTPSKVKMVVYREETSQKEEDMYDIINVQLTKKQGKGLGLSIVGRKNGPGVFISDLVPSGVAESDGRLMQGDQILEVNKEDLRNATQEQAAAVLKCASASVSMKIGRLKPGKKVAQPTNLTWPVTISDGAPRRPAMSPDSPFPQPPLLLSSHIVQQAQSISPPLQAIPPPQQDAPNPTSPPAVRTVLLDRGDDGLGFSIVGGFGSNLGDLPIYVKSVFDRGAAAREGSLRRGDQILKVNGQSLAGLTHAQAVAILKEARGTVTLSILPSK